MNIRGKSSPIQSNIRTVPTPTRGQTPPPASQLRGSHFEDPSHYQAHFQAASAAYQPSQQAYLDMNKPAPGRVSGPGLAQAPQGFNVQRGGQHPNYNLVAESQDQPAPHLWPNPQPGSYVNFIPTAAGQNMRQPRMQAAMNNSQLFMSNMPNMTTIYPGMAPSYGGNQALPFVHNPSNQFMPYSQPRMPFQTMPQQQQLQFMQQYGPTNTPYATAAYYPPAAMSMPNTSRPSSAGAQGAMGPKPHRNRKMLSLTDPTTGEDLTEKVFKPTGGEEVDPAVAESQAHREAVHLEFARKVAFLAKDKHPAEGSHAIQITAPPPGPEVPAHPAVMEEPPVAPHGLQQDVPHSVVVEQPVLVMNGEPETNIPEQVLSVQPPVPLYSTPAKEEFEPSPPSVETMAAAPDVQTPSPALPAAPSMPVVSDMAAPVNVAPKLDMPPPSHVEIPPPSVVEMSAAPVMEMSPPPVVEKPPTAVAEKEPTPPVAESAAMAPPSAVNPMLPTAVSAADAAKIVREVSPPVDSKPPPTPASAPKTESSASEDPQPSTSQTAQPQDVQPQSSAQAAQPSAPESQPTSQAAQPQLSQPPPPQPQRDGRKSGRKHKRELNKKSKEGSEMDAFYVTQPEAPQQENAGVAAPLETSPQNTPSPTLSSSTTSPPPSISPAPAVEVPPAAAASSPQPETVPEPAASAPEVEEKPQQPLLPDPEKPSNHVAPEPTPPTAPMAAEVSEEAAAESSSSVPEIEVEEPAENGAQEEEVEEGRENGEVGESDMEDIQKRLENGLGLNYKEGHWSPVNPDGKKQYDREFLLKLQGNPESRKAPELPHMQELIVDPRTKSEDLQRAQLAATRSVPDFTPGFFKSYNRPTPSLTKRNSQQRGRGGPGSQSGEQQQRIIISQRQEVQLHKASNAYKPQFQMPGSTYVYASPEEKDKDKDNKEKQPVPVVLTDSELFRKFQGILNKLTPEKFLKLAGQALEMKLDTSVRLTGIADLIFEKAISEQKFATVYADFCKELLKVPKVIVEETQKEVTFRATLLTKCQKEFEKDTNAENELDSRLAALENSEENVSEEKKAQVKEEIAEAMKEARHRSMGNIRFIGELFRLKMLTENIMHDCIFKLLKQRDDDSIECLTKLLDTIGEDLDHAKAKTRMDQYFAQLEKMVADMRPETGRPAAASSRGKETYKLSSRVKFGVLDILDLRKNRWVKRRIHDQNKPTTISAVHQKVREEEQAVQYMMSQPRQQDNSGPRGGGGARPKVGAGGRGSAQGDADGWNTVTARSVKQQIEPTRMKLTKQTPVDVNNVTLGGGNKFQNWGRGSQGGGSRSQEQERLGNRYNALNNLADSDGRRGGYGRSPARGDNRGGGRMDRDHDRRDRDRDRDRDFRRPVSRASMEERERAVANTRNMLGAVGGSSNPSSRNASRDNSRSRDTPPEAAARKTSGIDASKMSTDELDRRINTITEELIVNQNFKDTQESIQELKNLDYSMLVMTMLEKVLEKSSAARQQFGMFLFYLVREKQLTIENLIKGLAQFLEVGEDLELDVPRIWDYVAEVLASLMVDNKILPLSFLQACMQPLLSQGSKAAILLSKTCKLAADAMGREHVQALWAASGLQMSDFGLSDSDLPWLKARKRIFEEVLQRLRAGESNEELFQWIDRNVKREERESNQFARELSSAICRNSIDSYTDKKAMISDLKKRALLVRKYLDTQEKGTQALFGVQFLMCELEHPQGLVSTLFETFYDEDMITEESFFDWEARDGPPEDMLGKGIVLMNLRSFFESLRTCNEEDRTS